MTAENSDSTRFERRVRFDKGYDCIEECRHETKGDHGIASVRVTFLLIGEKGAVQFVHSTNWYPVSAIRRAGARLFDATIRPEWARGHPADLGYHAHEPRWEGQDRMGYCDVLHPEDPALGCYYDGSGLNAEPMFEVLIEQGEDGLWEALENYYREVFEGGAGGGFGELIHAFSEAARGSQDDTQEVVAVELDKCWRCGAEIPREDEVGLCVECKTTLAGADS